LPHEDDGGPECNRAKGTGKSEGPAGRTASGAAGEERERGGSRGRRASKELGREREHLTPDEIEKLAAAAKRNRHGLRDWLMVILGYRHGLRATELVNLRRDDVNFDAGVLHVTRLKNGDASTHPLQGDTLRALRRLFREAPASPFVFVSERGAPFTRAGFQKMVVRAGVGSGLRVRGSPAHAAPRCGLQAGQRQRGYTDDPGIPGTQVDPPHGALHRAGSRQVPWALEVSDEPIIDLGYIARSLDRLTTEVATMRDDLNVAAAILHRLDNNLRVLAELRSAAIAGQDG
jgi:type 1 fimbriae regulatory protein FimB/type 1 fimbriae regulatory protein FimE